MLRIVQVSVLILNTLNSISRNRLHTFALRNRLLRRVNLLYVKFNQIKMRQRSISIKNRSFATLVEQMEKIISMITLEKPIERIQTLECKIGKVEKIQEIEGNIEQIKDRIWTVKEVLTTSEASAYLGLSESYIYKLTSAKQIPHYKPNGKLVYFSRNELSEWAMKNRIQPVEPEVLTKIERL